MPRFLYPLLIALILICGGGYFWWNSQPEQQIGRRVDLFLDAVRFEKLSLKKQETRHQDFRTVFADDVDFTGKDYFPNSTLSLSEITNKLDEFHGMISLCEITELARETAVNDNEAQVELELKIKAAAGPNFKKTQTWTFTMNFEKAESWQVVQMSGRPVTSHD